MAKQFFERLQSYYRKVAEVIRGEADLAAIFPNSVDIGQSREEVYSQFLQQHAPSKCNVFLGGFLFDENGAESSQIDIIIATDTAPRFLFPNSSNKSFCPVEGAIGVASIKSFLNKSELDNALKGLASVPPTQDLSGRLPMYIKLKNYEDWPYKIIYACDGISGEKMHDHVTVFYKNHPEIPYSRRPNIIHVAGKYVLLRTSIGTKRRLSNGEFQSVEPGSFIVKYTEADLIGISEVLDNLQKKAAYSSHILYTYDWMKKRVSE